VAASEDRPHMGGISARSRRSCGATHHVYAANARANQSDFPLKSRSVKSLLTAHRLFHGTFALQPRHFRAATSTVYETIFISWEYACVPSYRLDDRIRELCAQATAADDTSFTEVLSELQSALREHTARLRGVAMRELVARKQQRLQPEGEPCKPLATRTNE
jgi:hypothetical protein